MCISDVAFAKFLVMFRAAEKDASTAASFIVASWDFAPCISGYDRRLREHIAPVFRLSLCDRVAYLCCRGIAFDQPLNRGIPFMTETHCLLGCFPVCIIYVCILHNCTV
jgi:hypothetical protein